jgi:hypothetical protein
MALSKEIFASAWNCLLVHSAIDYFVTFFRQKKSNQKCLPARQVNLRQQLPRLADSLDELLYIVNWTFRVLHRSENYGYGL